MVDYQGDSPFVLICHFSSIAHVTYYSPVASSAPHCVTHSTEATVRFLHSLQKLAIVPACFSHPPKSCSALVILRLCLGSSVQHLGAWAHASQLSLVSPLPLSKTSFRVTNNKHQPLFCMRNVFSQAKDIYPCRYAESAFQ